MLSSRDAKGAETLLRDSIDEIRNHHGADCPALLPLLDGLSTTLLEQHGGPTDEMLMLANERLRISRSAYGEQSEKAAESILFIAYHHQLTGDVPVAEKYYRDGIAVAEKACASAKCWTRSAACRSTDSPDFAVSLDAVRTGRHTCHTSPIRTILTRWARPR